jgi:integrase/recombinase XerC
MRLATAIGRFLDGYFATRDRSEKTYKAYACDLRQLGHFAGADAELTALDPDLIESWAAELKRREYAPASIQRKMVSLRVFSHYWVRKQEIEENPFWRVRLSFGRTRQLPRTLTEGEIRRLLDQARRDWEQSPDDRDRPDNGDDPAQTPAAGPSPRSRSEPSSETTSAPGSGPMPAPGWISPRFLALRNYAFLDLLFATGIRVGEAASLTLSSYNEEERAYHVRGKGRRPRLAFLVDPDSLRLQATYRHARRAIQAPTDALFLNLHRAALSTQGMANILEKLRREARLQKRITPHMIRHTIATLLLRNGVDLRVVQEFLGHASITSTQRYTHISKTHLVAALREGHPGLG